MKHSSTVDMSWNNARNMMGETTQNLKIAILLKFHGRKASIRKFAQGDDGHLLRCSGIAD